MHTYRITLKPDGIPLYEADDIKIFMFKPDGTTPTELHTLAKTHIVDEKLIDPGIFNKYWEIASVTQYDPDTETLKNKLIDLSPDDASKLQTIRSNESTTTFPMTFLSNRIDGWETGTLVLKDNTATAYQQWKQDFKNTQQPTKTQLQYLHEMMLYTATDAASAYTESVPTTPGAHDQFLNTAMRFDALLADHLSRIKP